MTFVKHTPSEGPRPAGPPVSPPFAVSCALVPVSAWFNSGARASHGACAACNMSPTLRGSCRRCPPPRSEVKRILSRVFPPHERATNMPHMAFEGPVSSPGAISWPKQRFRVSAGGGGGGDWGTLSSDDLWNSFQFRDAERPLNVDSGIVLAEPGGMKGHRASCCLAPCLS